MLQCKKGILQQAVRSCTKYLEVLEEIHLAWSQRLYFTTISILTERVTLNKSYNLSDLYRMRGSDQIISGTSSLFCAVYCVIQSCDLDQPQYTIVPNVPSSNNRFILLLKCFTNIKYIHVGFLFLHSHITLWIGYENRIQFY